MSLSSKEQDLILHSAAVEFAIANYKNPTRPKGSVILAAAENFAEANEFEATNPEQKVIISQFLKKVDDILNLLRNEHPKTIREDRRSSV